MSDSDSDPPTPERENDTTASRTEALAALRLLLPPSWEVLDQREPMERDRRLDAVATLVAPDGRRGTLLFELRGRLSPAAARAAADQLLTAARDRPSGVPVVVAPWLSPRTMTVLRQHEMGYLDLTGNAHIVMSEPGFALSVEGARRDPDPPRTVAPSLRGPRAWALLRTLIDVSPPYGVRELAAATGIDAGYVSRVLAVLEQELLVDRARRGPVVSVDWHGVLRQVAASYLLLRANRTSTWIAPAGAERFLDELVVRAPQQWAVTGSFGAARLAPVAAPSIAVVFVKDPRATAVELGLLPADHGANVVLARPYDGIVFSRTWEDSGIRFASIAQLALDGLSGMGRMPAEAEALLGWMRQDETRWRAPSLVASVNPLEAR